MAEVSIGGRGRRRPRYALRVVAVGYVSILVVVPVVLVFWRTVEQGGSTFWSSISSSDATHAFELTGIVVAWSVLLNTVFGLGVSLLLARYHFPGRRLLNLLIDVPVSVSPIVVGVALVLVYGPENGWFGPTLRGQGIEIIFKTPGMVLATMFVSLPLVVREIVPVLEELGVDQELAARSLGAHALQRFWRITLPSIKAALAYGVVLSIARSIGEFGAVRVVSGDFIGQTQTATLLVDERAEQFEPGAYQASLVLIVIAVVCMVAVSVLNAKEEH